MKKIYSLSLVALFAISATAQVMTQAESFKPATFNGKKMLQMEGTMDRSTQALEGDFKLTKRAAKAAGVSDTLDYLRPTGAFFVGMSSDLGLYNPRIICDTVDTMTFYNNSAIHSGSNTYWMMVSSQGIGIDTAWNLELEPLPEAYYYYPIPSLVILDETDEENITVLNSYQYGSAYADKAYVFAKPEYALPLTTCAMYTDTLYDEDSQDYWAVGAEPYGKYAYGSNLNVSDTETPYYADTLITLFDNLTTMHIDSAFLAIYNFDANSIAEMIPAGATIQLELLPVGINAQGKIVIGSTPYATASATNTDAYVYNLSNGGIVASLNFAFGTKNALGGFTPQPVDISGPFAARLSGFSSNGCDFGIYTDYYYSESQTYFVIDGGMYGLWRDPSNILLSLNATFVAKSAQGVENVETKAIKAEKMIRDGQLIIKKGDKEFNVLGAQL